MAKSDNRGDNETSMQDQIGHTFVNLQKAEAYLDEHADEIPGDEKESIEAKNDRRKASISNLMGEKQTDEARR